MSEPFVKGGSIEGMQNPLQYITIGEIVRSYRKQADITLGELAKRTGINKGVLSKLESNQTKRPALKTLKAIVSVLHIPYMKILEHYIEVEGRSEVLRTLLLEAMEASTPSMITKVASKFLATPQQETYHAVGQLYEIADSVSDDVTKLTLFNVLISYTRIRGVQMYLAKSLLQKYLIVRTDLKRLEETYKDGKDILPYVDFLSESEQITFYYRLGLHAHNTKRYSECIEWCQHAISLDKTTNELKAGAYIALCNSHIHLGQYTEAEEYLDVYETLPFDYVGEYAKHTRAMIKAKKKEYDLAIPMLREGFSQLRQSGRIHAANALLEIYADIHDIESTGDLIGMEATFLVTDVNTPVKHEELGRYYRWKAIYQTQKGLFREAVDCYLQSILHYRKVSAHEEINECMRDILELHCVHEKHMDLELLRKIKEVYSIISDNNHE